MSVQSEKNILIDLLQNINDLSLLKKVKAFVINEIEPLDLTEKQEKELEKRVFFHKKEEQKSGEDGFIFLDKIKSKYDL
ncbi:hypothetical protein [Flavobacterium sp.]|uniref:hypothetical protein n=1 Tax=Flavobacterium sp. TaxID=239 RepID=UPI00404858EB